ncbi:uncharacterized protein LOC122265723 [Penaeus japonicus]|uniref:uncharacterized protein LOC122265723 n=1 Tax=Penaeus japonicus TaxID=27405 RepID=UPI001C70D0AA|nr:uncharacterized protein LOC122265723 [Penaeus japonicus]
MQASGVVVLLFLALLLVSEATEQKTQTIDIPRERRSSLFGKMSKMFKSTKSFAKTTRKMKKKKKKNRYECSSPSCSNSTGMCLVQPASVAWPSAFLVLQLLN